MVDVAFGCEVDECVGCFAGEEGVDESGVCDVAFYKAVVGQVRAMSARFSRLPA